MSCYRRTEYDGLQPYRDRFCVSIGMGVFDVNFNQQWRAFHPTLGRLPRGAQTFELTCCIFTQSLDCASVRADYHGGRYLRSTVLPWPVARSLVRLRDTEHMTR